MSDFASPVFIVGSARSATSILLGSLQKAGYFGFNEGQFLPLIRAMERDIDRHYTVFQTPNDKVLISRIDPNMLKHRIADLLVGEALKHQARTPWVDKTGGAEMIETIPTLQRIFPTSRFIFAKRRGIENLVSRLIKFPATPFEAHCHGWAKTMDSWRALRRQLPGLACVEIDQRDISQNPGGVADLIARFLTLSPEAGASLSKTFSRARPQQTADGTADRVLSLDGVHWTPAEKKIFMDICGPVMANYGYTVDNSYRAS